MMHGLNNLICILKNRVRGSGLFFSVNMKAFVSERYVGG
jgi:hypothetical protein